MNLVRAKMLENSINEYLINHPKATIVSLGAGLDTTFSRVDNGLLIWYDIDLPDVIEIRKDSQKVKPILDAMETLARRGVPKWISLEKENFKATLTSIPTREDLTMPIQEQLIIELYSK